MKCSTPGCDHDLNLPDGAYALATTKCTSCMWEESKKGNPSSAFSALATAKPKPKK